MKRRNAEWGDISSNDIQDIARRLAKIEKEGVGTESLELDESHIILHFKMPKAFSEHDHDHIVQYIRDLKEKLPENCFCLITPKDINLQVHRPEVSKDKIDRIEDAIETLKDLMQTMANNVTEHVDHIDNLMTRVEALEDERPK